VTTRLSLHDFFGNAENLFLFKPALLLRPWGLGAVCAYGSCEESCTND
jgi:hypothetical protein